MDSINSNQLLEKTFFTNSTQISQSSRDSLYAFMDYVKQKMSTQQFDFHLGQWAIFGKKFDTSSKISSLKQQNYKKLLFPFIKGGAMELFQPSYFNRAKIDDEYIYWLQKLGPIYFSDVLKITSKLKIIHKHFYDKLRKSVLQNHVQIKMLKILQLCNQKKRSVNSNKNKFLCIVQDEADRVSLTKQLSKMLRQSWKLDKKKYLLLQDIQQNQVNQNQSQQYYFDGLDEVLQRGISINHEYQQRDSLDLNFI